jgi:hypothetical protein
MFHDGNREMQQRFDTTRLADRIEDKVVHATLTDHDKAFVERVDCFFLATADADRKPTCSYKGGDPGFVRAVDDHTLAFPCYDGNGMFLSMGNVIVNPSVGMLFVDFENAWRMRVQGEASITEGDPLLAEYPEAQLVVRVQVTEVFANCPRYIHKRTLVERSPFVPRAGEETPVPEWKRADWAKDVLPRS